MIKEVPAPDWECKGCVFNGKFKCLGMPCGADPDNPIKYIEVED